MADKFGQEQVLIWRRAFDAPPPECPPDSHMHPENDPKYRHIPEARSIKTESLKTTLDRVLPYWHEEIAPQIKAGKRIILSGHRNSLRALVKYLDGISDHGITELLNIPTGVPLIYEIDEKTMKVIPHKDAIAPLQVCIFLLLLIGFVLTFFLIFLCFL
jgi:2,3-bisphosphoglycerate-dependent phosphoglycerate mutase